MKQRLKTFHLGAQTCLMTHEITAVFYLCQFTVAANIAVPFFFLNNQKSPVETRIIMSPHLHPLLFMVEFEPMTLIIMFVRSV